jgi:thiosulfate/3-mercaptopyruvate sulfurtransferase
MSEQAASRWLVTTDWLASRLGAPDLVVVDGSYYLPAHKRDAAADYIAGHIPGAVRFDVDDVSDHAQSLPHMLPSAPAFAAKVGALGIGSDDTIVIYDGLGMFSSPRVWWTFRLFGAEKVFILEGGMPKWQAERHPVEAGLIARAPRKFAARMNPNIIAALPKIQSALADQSAQVVDARPADRFRGDAPEPRPGVRPGHIPGSLCTRSRTRRRGCPVRARRRCSRMTRRRGRQARTSRAVLRTTRQPTSVRKPRRPVRGWPASAWSVRTRCTSARESARPRRVGAKYTSPAG